VAKKTALAVTLEAQREEIMEFEFEVESNKGMLDNKENGRKNSMMLLPHRRRSVKQSKRLQILL
jgi:hypothetical protein